MTHRALQFNRNEHFFTNGISAKRVSDTIQLNYMYVRIKTFNRLVQRLPFPVFA